ncbi:kinase [Amycolatopsis rhabdoformis]|uniref:Kinase n=1 Tax=Amycolatopsis rhabdoformis TaxID=1448059 RepID=A0ABZ1I028_9PSEU|nr:kinase [Amycolatopsis rhabdoformis]WSE27152.1 kinase [Amycolatopsis rhabdoformis]
MPRLVLLRGPSGAGKTTIARTLRTHWGRGTALVRQDVVRREILREHDVPGGVNIGLIDVMCRHTLAAGYDVILEGIFPAARYGEMLRRLLADHDGSAFFFAVPFPETVRRHATRPQSTEFTPEDMRGWYLPDDRLGVPGEVVLGPELAVKETVALIDAAVRRRCC